MADAPAAAAPKPSASPLLMMMLMFLMLWILLDSTMRNAIGSIVGFVFQPTIGFDYDFPMWTVLAAGIIAIAFSTLVRHFMIDWVEMARVQKRMSAIRKESFAAMKRRDMNRVEQLSKIQQESGAETMSMTMGQMKPTMITMIMVVGGFTWLWLFITEAPHHFFSVPWEPVVDFTRSNVLPNWILLYSLLTMPVGQVLGRVLKLYSFNKRMKRLEAA
jgi:uncharacterized membrane protein (DUF106 family)